MTIFIVARFPLGIVR